MSTHIDYEQQAQAFLKKFSIRFRATLSDSKVSPWSNGDGESGRHYRVTFSKSTKQWLPRNPNHPARLAEFPKRITFDFFGSIADARSGTHPSAYDVLAFISGDVHCADTFKEFCSEFGESEDSIKALQTWRRCAAFSKRLKSFFSSEEIDALSEIQ